MRGKASLVAVVTITLSLTFVSPGSAATKAGGTCKTLGTSIIEGSKIFTCIKSGKKLVWSKGITIPGATVGAIPTQSQPSQSQSQPTQSQPAPTQSAAPKPPAVATLNNPALAGAKTTVGKIAIRTEGSNNSVIADVCADNGARDGCTFDSKFNGIPDPKANVWWYAVRVTIFNLDSKIIDMGSLDRTFKIATDAGMLIDADFSSLDDNLLAFGQIVPSGSANGRFYFKIPSGTKVKSLLILSDQSNWPIDTQDYYFLTEPEGMASPAIVALPSTSASGELASFTNPVPYGSSFAAGKVQIRIDGRLQPATALICADNGAREGCKFDSSYNGIVDPAAKVGWQSLALTVTNLDSKILDLGSLDRTFKITFSNGNLRDADYVGIKGALNFSTKLLPGGSASGKLYFKAKNTVVFGNLMVLRDITNWPTSTSDYYFSIA